MMATHPPGMEGLRGELRPNEPMARHTSLRAGGPADRYYVPADLEDLTVFLASLPAGEPLVWLGLGSNLLVRDGGIRGTVIATVRALGGIARLGGDRLRVEAGVPCARVARAAAAAGLEGAEFLVGIPGTMGGALAMNAGAFGGETWDRVVAVETLDRRGRRRRRTPADYRVGYRSVAGPPGEWFVAAELALVPGDGAVARERIRDCLRRRSETQPTGAASCGSVFRNPPGDHAGRLLEQAGVKGRRVGAARVSERHANFIINEGGATARDIERLIREMQDAVARESGIRLEPEVHILGEAAT